MPRDLHYNDSHGMFMVTLLAILHHICSSDMIKSFVRDHMSEIVLLEQFIFFLHQQNLQMQRDW